ncbi:7279_t:CDS:1, partial [Rhizophagus irregularis]
EFMTLNRNRIRYQSEVLELIDWKTSLKLNCIDQHYTLFEDYFLQSFRTKICCNELPTCVNLRKRKPDLYDDS